MDIKTLKNRHKQIRLAMSQAGVDCLIVTKSANVTYLTGFMGQDSWALVTPQKVAIITDSRYSEQASIECSGCRIIVRRERMINTVVRLLQKQRKERIAIEKSASIAEFEHLKKQLKGRFKSVANIVETARRIKDRGEIAAIRKAAKIAANAFAIIKRRIKPGMTENELAGILDLEIRKAGGCNAFETIVAFGPNASRPHHSPSNRKLRKNDSILIDFGVRYGGYCCDITRCLTLGNASSLYKKAYEAVLSAQSAAVREIKAGVDIQKVDSAARKAVRKSGLPVYGHGTGHGLGLEVHELPSLSPKSEGTLQAGDIVTIEPGIYLPGKLGIRIEDDVLVTEKGPVLLSKIS